MKIEHHPLIQSIVIGDEVYSFRAQLFARVEDVFPAAVCVKIAALSFRDRLELLLLPQLWRADEIENLSICRWCGSREGLVVENDTGIPYRVCSHCQAERVSDE